MRNQFISFYFLFLFLFVLFSFTPSTHAICPDGVLDTGETCDNNASFVGLLVGSSCCSPSCSSLTITKPSLIQEIFCTVASQCNDNDSRTTDTCLSGRCRNTPAALTVPCTTLDQCPQFPCYNASTCSGGFCSYSVAQNIASLKATRCRNESVCSFDLQCDTGTSPGRVISTTLSWSLAAAGTAQNTFYCNQSAKLASQLTAITWTQSSAAFGPPVVDYTITATNCKLTAVITNNGSPNAALQYFGPWNSAGAACSYTISAKPRCTTNAQSVTINTASLFQCCGDGVVQAPEACDEVSGCCSSTCTCTAQNTYRYLYNGTCCSGSCSSIPTTQPTLIREQICVVDTDCQDNDSTTTNTCNSGFCMYRPIGVACSPSGPACRQYPCWSGTCPFNACVYSAASNLYNFYPSSCFQEDSCVFNLACSSGVVRGSPATFFMSATATNGRIYCNKPPSLASQLVTITWQYGTSSLFGPPVIDYNITANPCKLTPVITNNNSPNAAIQYIGTWNALGAQCGYTITATARCNHPAILPRTITFNTATTVGCCNDGTQQPEESCDGGVCCTAQCTALPSNVTCRNVSGPCDQAEFCTGTSGTCPADTFIPASSNVVCRAAAGLCDITETCSGTSASCPTDSIRPAGYICNNTYSAAACSNNTICNGVSTQCPSTAPPLAATIQCRSVAGVCDAAEYCTGSSLGCPVDRPAASGTVCRGSAGVCDIAETCNGTSFVCPGDSYLNSTVVCRPVADVCDVAEYCTGLSATCGVDTFLPVTTVCRPAVDVCDWPDTCSGSASCRSDAWKSSLVVCRAANASNCIAASVCPGTVGGVCPSPAPAASNVVCRSSAGTCDIQETCTGTSIGCPTDQFVNSSVVCRASAGVCDVIETCSGSGASCPIDVFANNSVICRAAAGPCDAPETCGTGASCPIDLKRPTGYVCGLAATTPTPNCDADDVCDGFSITCPATIRPKNYICRPRTGPCDIDELCDGTTTICPPDQFQGALGVCRAAVGPCDILERCTGTTGPCPADLFQPSTYACYTGTATCTIKQNCTGLSGFCPSNIAPFGTPCNLDNNLCTVDVCQGINATCIPQSTINYDDGQFCNGVETCNPATGLMVPGTPINCNDGNSCTSDTCDEVNDVCVHTPIVNSSGPCGATNNIGLCHFGNYSCIGIGPSPVISCVGAVFPTTEACIPVGFDENCNGLVDENCNTTVCSVDSQCSGISVGSCEEAFCNVSITICQIRSKTDGASCSDGLSCTTGDQCVSGLCVGTVVVCNDLNPCTQDTCSEPTGLCQYNGAPNQGLPCNADNNLCTTNDACNNQGQCIAGTVLTCPDDQLPCQDLLCNPSDGLCHSVNLTGACSDGLGCTTNDQCVGGQCIGSPTVCNDFISCTVDTCQEPSGSCSSQLSPGKCYIAGVCYNDGDVNPGDPCLVCRSLSSATQWSYTTFLNVSCNDGLLCTSNDLCIPATQQCHGTPVDCSSFSNQCNLGVCSPLTGLCSSQHVSMGTPCDDNTFCTVADICVAGACQGSPRDCSAISTQCAVGFCNEGADSCVLIPYQDGSPCVLTSTVCDGSEYCSAGDCVHGTPLVCPSSTQCSSYSCDPVRGCLPTFFDQTNSCTDDNICTVGDACDGSGGCSAGQNFLDCDDHDDCTDDFCDPFSGCYHVQLTDCLFCNNSVPCSSQSCFDVVCVGTHCEYTQQPEGTSCADQNVCNGQETCDPNGVCVSGSPLVCDDLNPCTDDTCSPQIGCIFIPNELLLFDDGDACTINDRCSAHGIGIADPYPCPSPTACQSFACQSINNLPSCVATAINVGGPCDDGIACTERDLCDSLGNCHGTPIVCPAPSQCESEVLCVDGQCTPLFFGEGVPCESGNLCTDDFCSGFGVCVQGPQTIFCEPLDQCHDGGVCIPESGLCTTPILVDGTACSDGDLCSQTDICLGGQCIGTNHVVCAALDQCHLPGVCIPESGLCTQPFAPDNTLCVDGDLCTTPDLCFQGVCIGSGHLDCSDPNPCITTSCNSTTGCVQAYNTDPCDDGNACTVETHCVSGSCSSGSGTPLNCDDENVCTQDDCLPQSGCVHSPIVDCLSCDTASDCSAIPCKRAQCVLHQCTYVDDDTNIVGCLNSQFCDGQEQCISGVCVHGTAPDCSDSNECTFDVCNYTLGLCTHDSNVGNACAGSDLCSTSSVCNAHGQCVPDQVVHCDPAPPCHILVGCNPSTGLCDYLPLPDQSPCSDGNPCTQVDVCLSGACTGTQPVHCNPLDQCHTQGVCDVQTGLCTNPQSADGTPCDDGLFCTSGDQCVGGQCAYQSVYTCSDVVRDPQCQDVVCNESLDRCIIENLPSTTPCDTGLPQGSCSAQDLCSAGQCQQVYSVGVICRPADESGCDLAEFCGEDDLCPLDSKQSEGTPCLDNLFCADSTCHAGSCEPSTPRDCSSLDDQCQIGVCNEQINACEAIARPDNTPCSTGSPANPCVQFESCQVGQCTPHYAPVSSPCDDFNACTLGDHCSGSNGTCISGAQKNCASSNSECTLGVCNSQTGLCESHPVHETQPCGVNDNPCVARSCVLGVCTAYYNNVSTPCDDANQCTIGDYCSGVDSTCVPGTAISCDHLNGQCTAGICNIQTGLCYSQSVHEGETCDADHNPCTVSDVCSSGVCLAGAPKNCSYLNATCGYGACRVINGTDAECYQVLLTAQCDPDLCSGGCTLSQGYWSTHSKYAKNNGLKRPWPLGMEDTLICGKTWYQWSQVRSKGFAWRKLFEQYMAARLNVISGACVSTTLNVSLVQATILLQQCNLNLLASNPLAIVYKQLTGIFDSYNTGKTGPGHCIDEACVSLSWESDDDSTSACTSDDRTSQNEIGHRTDLHHVDRAMVEREEDAPPVLSFFENIGAEIACVNGLWDWIASECVCRTGWAGISCEECGVPSLADSTYLCVPTRTVQPTYLLRTIPNDMLSKYIGPDANLFIEASNLPSVYPNTNGLDCVCQSDDQPVVTPSAKHSLESKSHRSTIRGEAISNHHHSTIKEVAKKSEKSLVLDQDDWTLWWWFYEQNLIFCENTWDTDEWNCTRNHTNDTIVLIVSDDDDDGGLHHEEHHHTLFIVFGCIFAAILLIVFCIWLIGYTTENGISRISDKLSEVNTVGKKIIKQNPRLGELIEFQTPHLH